MRGACLAITVDVDGPAGLPGGGAGFAHRLSRVSERSYGLGAGLERLLAILDEFAAPATFYVPGVTAADHADVIRALAERHEVGHHGHTHRFPHRLDPAEQQREIALGLEALEAVTGHPPSGYRAPGWELTTATLEAVAAAGLDLDSSLMGDDRPYLIEAAGRRLVELPVHWALDDAPHFAHTTDPSGLLAAWDAELRAAHHEARPITITCHPEILGRAHRAEILRRLLASAADLAVPLVSHGELAAAWARA